jgi:hypothetical protein
MFIVALACAGEVHAQQSQLSVSAAAQVYAADQYRIVGMNRVEPDLGVSWLKPDVFGGTLGLDVNITRRNDSAQLGRALLSLKSVKAGGFTWDVTAGDSGTPPFVPDFGYSNLSAPLLTFAGASVSASNGRVTVRAAGGRSTQTRNIFGTDLRDLDQRFAQADVSINVSRAFQMTARASRIENGTIEIYPTFVNWSEDTGAGFVFKAARYWRITGDLGVSRFERRGADQTETSPSWLIGTVLEGSRGRLEVNAQQFSVGRFAAVNYPYNDRRGVFAAGEFVVSQPLRLFGGADVSHTNLDPNAPGTVAMPDGSQTRSYGGVRLQWARHSTFTVRAEGGGREIVASRFTPGFETDTGGLMAEWHGNFSRTTVFTRYERRSNVDANYAQSSFRQHEVSSQVFLHLAKGREIFGQGFIIRRADRLGGGETDWYVGAGLQLPIEPLYFRLEGTVGRTDDWETDRRANRQVIVASLTGQIARRTYLSADVMVHHAPLDVPGSHPWYTRSMVRLTRSLTYGSILVPSADGALPLTGPLGSVDSHVFIDWNGNGARDAEDEAASGVSVSIVRVGSTSAGKDGRALFSRVPAGDRLVSLDLSTVPADYDIPDEAARTITVERGKRATVDFGLLPVGAVQGTVLVDEDNDGTLSAADKPRDGVVVTLDDGTRSELARDGRFRFDNVRLGPHSVAVEMESLDVGTQMVGDASRPVTLTRDVRDANVVFLIRLEKRPEVRKVFPAKKVLVPQLHGAAEPDTDTTVAAATAAPEQTKAPAARPSTSVKKAAGAQTQAGSRATGRSGRTGAESHQH